MELSGSVIVFGDETRDFTFVRDLSERNAAGRALRESELRHRLLFESNPQPMWMYDLESLRFLAVNEATIREYGYSRDEFLELTVEQIRPSGELPRFRALLAGSRGPFSPSDEWKHVRKDGSVREVEICSQQLTLDGRNACLVVAFDVTERKLAADALRESEARFRRAVEEPPIPGHDPC